MRRSQAAYAVVLALLALARPFAGVAHANHRHIACPEHEGEVLELESDAVAIEKSSAEPALRAGGAPDAAHEHCPIHTFQAPAGVIVARSTAAMAIAGTPNLRVYEGEGGAPLSALDVAPKCSPPRA